MVVMVVPGLGFMGPLETLTQDCKGLRNRSPPQTDNPYRKTIPQMCTRQRRHAAATAPQHPTHPGAPSMLESLRAAERRPPCALFSAQLPKRKFPMNDATYEEIKKELAEAFEAVKAAHRAARTLDEAAEAGSLGMQLIGIEMDLPQRKQRKVP